MVVNYVEGTRRFVAIYGKGGIGKTTVSTNFAVALSENGASVSLLGCSPKSSLMEVYKIEDRVSILDLLRKEGLSSNNFSSTAWTTESGIIMSDAGGPEPGIGCAGAGLKVAIDYFDRFENSIEGCSKVNYRIYDVIGDVVCGGFATPMRGAGERIVFIVISGELMAMYAANNILRAVSEMSVSGMSNIRIGGYIANMRGVPYEKEILQSFSDMTGVPVLASIPRDVKVFKEAEKVGKSVMEVFPDSEIAHIFRSLVKAIQGNQEISPTPIESYADLFGMFMRHQKEEAGKIKVEEYLYQDRIPLETVSRGLPKKCSIYGTGGIGKSTVSSNVSAALVLLGEKVYQIGCDPKRDSIVSLCGELKPTILDHLRENNTRDLSREMLMSLIYEGVGYKGRFYGSECGGPHPGKGCAGKGVALALNYIEKFEIFNDLGITFVLYDVLGDTVCGGFASPLKFANLTYIVTNGELASIMQAMKIAQSVCAVAEGGEKELGIAGIIDNHRGIPHESEIVEDVFRELGIPVIYHIPRSPIVQEAENLKRTVVQAFPESEQSRHYIELAKRIQKNEEKFLLKRNILTRNEVQKIINTYLK